MADLKTLDTQRPIRPECERQFTRLRRAVRRLKHVLVGNGKPEQSVVYRLAAMERVLRWQIRAMLGLLSAVVALLVAIAGNAIKAWAGW